MCSKFETHFCFFNLYRQLILITFTFKRFWREDFGIGYIKSIIQSNSFTRMN